MKKLDTTLGNKINDLEKQVYDLNKYLNNTTEIDEDYKNQIKRITTSLLNQI